MVGTRMGIADASTSAFDRTAMREVMSMRYELLHRRMKPGLESYRFGYDWSERYVARDFLDPVDDRKPVGRKVRVPVVANDDGR